MKPIEQIRKAFGRGHGLRCGGCRHFAPKVRPPGLRLNVGKCMAFGPDRTTDTDWSNKWTGCGLFDRALPAGFVPLRLRGGVGPPVGKQMTFDDLDSRERGLAMIRKAREAVR